MASVAMSDAMSLRQAVCRADKRGRNDWVETLVPRKLEEMQFHDAHRTAEEDGKHVGDQRANRRFYYTCEKSRQYKREWIATAARGKVFLDHACGEGESTVLAAQAGAKLAIGLDISPGSLASAEQRAREAGVADRTVFIQSDCEATGLPDESVDVVLCSGMLHHLDLEHAFPELERIMAPGAKCLAIEALNYNPLIRMYRRRTPELRTAWEKEHILSMKDVRFAREFFDVKNVKFWHMFTVLCTPLRNSPVFKPALAMANGLDALALRLYPLSLMAWQFSFELHKKAESGASLLSRAA